MGFLFDMLEKANGLNCQATNFLKSFSSHAQGKIFVENKKQKKRNTNSIG